MALLNADIRKDVQASLADVQSPVTFKVFTQQFECQYCKETRELIQEVAELSPHVQSLHATIRMPILQGNTRTDPGGRRTIASIERRDLRPSQG
jgi:alkyl hydroperoxide reductase subunit AhpF